MADLSLEMVDISIPRYGLTVRLFFFSSFYLHLTHSLPDYQNTQGIIFVVDSNDRERVSEARQELQGMITEEDLRDALILVFANKQDLPNAMDAAEITDKLGLHSLRQRTWYIQVGPQCS